MSGGSLNYFYALLQDHIGDFNDMELDDLVKDLAELFHDREWYLSGDTGEGSWSEARDEFKQKWFTDNGRNERIGEYLEECFDKIKKSLGVSIKYCKNCKHWTPKYETYGKCEYENHCVMHRSDSCGTFEERET